MQVLQRVEFSSALFTVELGTAAELSYLQKNGNPPAEE